MIKINDKEYYDYKTRITWGNFEVYTDGNKRTGESPFITFAVENNIFIGLEITFSKDMFMNTVLNKKVSLKKYISDITYEDEKGWRSIISGEYNCDITRTSVNNFKIELNIENDEFDVINIIIDTNIELL